ncbi:MAG: hypothetical protein IH604_11430 [Burkholderiales bacterium]|nr:hypothetical protein [Burkholderiales bacterium]
MKPIEHAMLVDPAVTIGPLAHQLAEPRMTTERLPFTVRIVRSEEALYKAVAIRQAAYARHVPIFAEGLKSPEPNDYDKGSMILLAESKMDGSPVGTIRVQANRFRKLTIEQSAELPIHMHGQNAVEATRLAVAEGRIGRVTKVVLIKALYLYCMEAKVDWVIAGARPPLDRQYDAFLMDDLYHGKLIPLRHAGNIPHRILALDVPGARTRWEQAGHSLFDFMCNTYHPDIDLSNADFAIWHRPAQHIDQGDMAAVCA